MRLNIRFKVRCALVGAGFALRAWPLPAKVPAGFGASVPRSQRVGKEPGGFIVASRPIGTLDPGSVY